MKRKLDEFDDNLLALAFGAAGYVCIGIAAAVCKLMEWLDRNPKKW